MDEPPNEHAILPDEIQRGHWALLAEWWCIPNDAAPARLIELILAHSPTPVNEPALVRDRLYGGFPCPDRHKRHVCYVTAQYTYLAQNVPLTPEQRQEGWHTLLTYNADAPFLGDGPFTDDAPRHGERLSLDAWEAQVDALLKEFEAPNTGDIRP